MKWLTLAGVVPIGLGIIVVFVSILRSKALFMAMPFVVSPNRPAIIRFLRHHRLLLILFLVGYVVLACAVLMGIPFFNGPIAGATCFLVAVFIYLSSLMESKLLLEMQKTLNALLPICSRCKKTRDPDSDGSKPESWIELETYISEETGTQVTHGLCPDCMNKFLLENKQLKKNI